MDLFRCVTGSSTNIEVCDVFTTLFAQDIKRQVDSIYAEGRFWPEPLIQINPSLPALEDR